jgi:hypothetical protein
MNRKILSTIFLEHQRCKIIKEFTLKIMVKKLLKYLSMNSHI